jgi:hypothetical protein
LRQHFVHEPPALDFAHRDPARDLVAAAQAALAIAVAVEATDADARAEDGDELRVLA